VQLTAPTLDGDALDLLRTLASHGEQLTFERGAVLIEQGAPADVLYLVLSGRFSIHVGGAPAAVAEIGQGQLIGEIGFFAGLARTATVVAVRDSRVLRITREQFATFSHTSPDLLRSIIASLARRLGGVVGPGLRGPGPVRTMTVIPAGASEAAPEFVAHLQTILGRIGRTLVLTDADIAARFGRSALDHPEVFDWLNALESEFEFVLYVAHAEVTDWTRKCIRQSDAILLVARAGASPKPNAVEQFACAIHRPSARRLVLLHAARSPVVTGTAAWLAPRDVFMHHHVALASDADVERLARFLSGRAVGFVAGSGGALGSAHLGVFKAFREAGVQFDIMGGTSVGSAMAAGLSFGVDPERVDDGTHNIFVKSRSFRRLTIPRYALLNHKVFDRALQAEYGDVLIEDLWMPFFAVSSNLSTQSVHLHRRGPVWEAVRASGSIPGVLPPFLTRDGEMLVDGALLDNIPLTSMRTLKTGPNIVVALSMEAPPRSRASYQDIPGPLELLWKMINPFAKATLPQIPSALQVIMLSMFANSRTALPLADGDVLVAPPPPHDLRFSGWDRHTEVFMHGYQWTAAWLKEQSASNPLLQQAARGP
jgi:NTE family protein